MIKYIEVRDRKYFSLDDIHEAFKKGKYSSEDWKVKAKILKIELDQYKKGLLIPFKFFILPDGGYYIHWTLAELVEPFYLKSKNPDRRKIFSLMDYCPAPDQGHEWFSYFQLVELSALITPAIHHQEAQ